MVTDMKNTRYEMYFRSMASLVIVVRVFEGLDLSAPANMSHSSLPGLFKPSIGMFDVHTNMKQTEPETDHLDRNGAEGLSAKLDRVGLHCTTAPEPVQM